jgi:hypothetical protein
MMIKRLLTIYLTVLTLGIVQAQEGMWLLDKLKSINEADMQQKGLKLTADDIYNINSSSMKDAVVRLGGGFCTGEMVSAEGLFLTNHHCGYSAVQSLSSVENDYLTDGFWAKTRQDELPAGFNVSFLHSIEDVTAKVLPELTDDMDENTRSMTVQQVGARLRSEAPKGNGLSTDFKVMYEGNEYYLYHYKSYRDVRLVGTPPNAIGKYGGDTDNWMWPRHTGDFAMFRVYMGPDGEPADPSEANVPYKPGHFFPVSLQGVEEGDIAMVMGFPGSTDRFLSSHGVQLALDIDQPSRVKIRGVKLDIMKEGMDASDEVRIKYAAKYAQVSNYWKYFIGQQRGLKRLRVYDKKKQQEQELIAWVNADAGRKARYGAFPELLERGYTERRKFERASTYMQEAAFGSEMIIMGFRTYGLLNQLRTDAKDAAAVSAAVAQVQAAADGFFKDYNAEVDQKITAAMFRLIAEDVEEDLQPTVIADIRKKYKGNFDAWAKAVFSNSMLVDRNKLDAFLAKPTLKAMEKDLGVQAMESCITHFRNILGPAVGASEADTDRGYRLMVAAMREKDPTRMWYPNANSTPRLTYGKVGSYYPADAVWYKHVTTHRGILEKEDPTNEEFIVPARQKELLLAKDFGRYADANGDLIPCFISSNDITGGNSGSPVINGNGELIGIAFDGNWEAMSGDIAFEPDLQRTISVDIRYVLWTIDKFAGAKHLVDEMTVVERKAPAPPVEDEAVAPTKPAKAPARK